MQRDTDKDWSQLAESEPYWAVLSVDQYRAGAMTEEARAQFYRDGARAARQLIEHIRFHFDQNWTPARVLDFGCGVGRMTLPFAETCLEEAVGLDIAEGMLRIAREKCASLDVQNCRFEKSDDALTAATGHFDLVNSFIVLQHIPTERGYRLIDRLIGKISPGGFGAIHLTYGVEGPDEADEEAPEGTISMFSYDLGRIMRQLAGVTQKPVVTFPREQQGHPGIYLLFQKS